LVTNTVRTVSSSAGTVSPSRNLLISGVITQRQDTIYNWDTFGDAPFATLLPNGTRVIGCSVGNVVASIPVLVPVSGTTATGSVGNISLAFDTALTSVSATGFAGNVIFGQDFGIFGNTAIGSVGTIDTPEKAFALTGVTGTGVVNTTFVRPVWTLINNASNGAPRG
jgi:hypothetical protein